MRHVSTSPRGKMLTLAQVARVLKPGGRWLYVTYRQPHFLKPLLAREHTWTMQVETLEDTPGSFEYFGFVITKKMQHVSSHPASS